MRVVYWLDGDGKRQQPQRLGPGVEATRYTQMGHAFVVTDEPGRALGTFVAADADGRASFR